MVQPVALSRYAALALLLAGAPACATSSAGVQRASPAPTPSARPSPAVSAVAAPSPATGSVFLIVMENKTASAALSPPFTSSPARQHASPNNYYAISHPSLPNYLALTSGDTYGITDDGYHRLGTQDLGHQLTSAGVSWRAYTVGLAHA